MLTYSIKVIISDLKKSDGKSQLRLRVIINRKKYEIGLNIYIKSIDYDVNRQFIKSNSFNSDNFNMIIKKALQKTQQYFLDCDLKEIPYSIEGFKYYFNKSNVNANDFYAFAELLLTKCMV